MPGRLRVLPDRTPLLADTEPAQTSDDPAKFRSRGRIRGQQPQQPGLPVPGDGQGRRLIGTRDLESRLIQRRFVVSACSGLNRRQSNPISRLTWLQASVASRFTIVVAPEAAKAASSSPTIPSLDSTHHNPAVIRTADLCAGGILTESLNGFSRRLSAVRARSPDMTGPDLSGRPPVRQHGRVTDRPTVTRWLAAYEAAWRAPAPGPWTPCSPPTPHTCSRPTTRRSPAWTPSAGCGAPNATVPGGLYPGHRDSGRRRPGRGGPGRSPPR